MMQKSYWICTKRTMQCLNYTIMGRMFPCLSGFMYEIGISTSYFLLHKTNTGISIKTQCILLNIHTIHILCLFSSLIVINCRMHTYSYSWPLLCIVPYRVNSLPRTLCHPLINVSVCNQGPLWFTGASVTNSFYCITWFNGYKSGRPSIRLTQHLHHCMTVGSVLCDCECCRCVFVKGVMAVYGVDTVPFAPILPDFHCLWECIVNSNGHISGILFIGDWHCYSHMSTVQSCVYRFCTICMNFSVLVCSGWRWKCIMNLQWIV